MPAVYRTAGIAADTRKPPEGGSQTFNQLRLATPMGFEPTISTVTGWHV